MDKHGRVGWNRISSFIQLPGSYLAFLVGLLISRIGDSLYTFAIPWIAYELTRSAIIMGSLYAITVLPIVLFGPFIGVVVDQWDRRRLMMASDVMRAVLVATVPGLYFLGLLQLWYLYVVSFVLTILALLFDVANIAFIPNMAGKDLTRANASYQLAMQMASIAGPILAGVTIALTGAFNTLWLDAVSFFATFFAVFRMPPLGKTARANSIGDVLKNMNAGFQWLIHDRLNLALSLQAMVGNFGYSAAAAVLMYYLLSTLHLNAQQSSFNFALIGVGGLVGALIVVPLEKRFRRGFLISVLLSIGTTGFMVAILVHFWLAPGFAFAIVATCNIAWNTLVQSLRQETVPEHMLGRVLGFSRVFTRIAMPLGAMVGGMVSSSFSPIAVFAIAGTTKAIEVLVAVLSPIRKM